MKKPRSIHYADLQAGNGNDESRRHMTILLLGSIPSPRSTINTLTNSVASTYHYRVRFNNNARQSILCIITLPHNKRCKYRVVVTSCAGCLIKRPQAALAAPIAVTNTKFCAVHTTNHRIDSIEHFHGTTH